MPSGLNGIFDAVYMRESEFATDFKGEYHSTYTNSLFGHNSDVFLLPPSIVDDNVKVALIRPIQVIRCL